MNSPMRRGRIPSPIAKRCSAIIRAHSRGRGVSVRFAFGSYVAQVAEVEVAANGSLKVHRIVCAVDCGMVVNPDTIEAQLQGGR
jgi:CO/xanthine dehydrogenase Mo-binding subunit